jgi:hypothetical protein
MIRTTVGILFISVSIAASAAEGVPTLAFEKTCRDAQGTAPSGAIIDACLSDERDAERRLAAGAWHAAKGSSRETCLANQHDGNRESYVELLTCIEIMDGRTLMPTNPH